MTAREPVRVSLRTLHALDAVNAAWKVGRLIDDRLGDPDPGRLGIWAQMFADAGLIDPHLAADAARSWYAPGRDRVMQPGDVTAEARRIRATQSEAAASRRALAPGNPATPERRAEFMAQIRNLAERKAMQ